jgi:chorismate mutase
MGSPDFMSKYEIMTPEIEAIDNEIMRLKGLRASMVAKAAKKKADALCAEMAAKKARR